MCSAAHVWRSLKNVPKLEHAVYSWVTGMTLRQLGFLSRWQIEVSDHCVKPNCGFLINQRRASGPVLGWCSPRRYSRVKEHFGQWASQQYPFRVKRSPGWGLNEAHPGSKKAYWPWMCSTSAPRGNSSRKAKWWQKGGEEGKIFTGLLFQLLFPLHWESWTWKLYKEEPQVGTQNCISCAVAPFLPETSWSLTLPLAKRPVLIPVPCAVLRAHRV